jgi:hypothetical protein
MYVTVNYERLAILVAARGGEGSESYAALLLTEGIKVVLYLVLFIVWHVAIFNWYAASAVEVI